VTTHIEARQIRKRVLLVFARIAILILLAVILFRIVVPYLFNLHTDLGLICAVAAALVGLAALIWFAFDTTTSFRQSRRS
jgi:hypothetical protein